jgi:hypothetical protein
MGLHERLNLAKASKRILTLEHAFLQLENHGIKLASPWNEHSIMRSIHSSGFNVKFESIILNSSRLIGLTMDWMDSFHFLWTAKWRPWTSREPRETYDFLAVDADDVMNHSTLIHEQRFSDYTVLPICPIDSICIPIPCELHGECDIVKQPGWYNRQYLELILRHGSGVSHRTKQLPKIRAIGPRHVTLLFQREQKTFALDPVVCPPPEYYEVMTKQIAAKIMATVGESILAPLSLSLRSQKDVPLDRWPIGQFNNIVNLDVENVSTDEVRRLLIRSRSTLRTLGIVRVKTAEVLNMALQGMDCGAASQFVTLRIHAIRVVSLYHLCRTPRSQRVCCPSIRYLTLGLVTPAHLSLWEEQALGHTNMAMLAEIFPSVEVLTIRWLASGPMDICLHSFKKLRSLHVFYGMDTPVVTTGVDIPPSLQEITWHIYPPVCPSGTDRLHERVRDFLKESGFKGYLHLIMTTGIRSNLLGTYSRGVVQFMPMEYFVHSKDTKVAVPHPRFLSASEVDDVVYWVKMPYRECKGCIIEARSVIRDTQNTKSERAVECKQCHELYQPMVTSRSRCPFCCESNGLKMPEKKKVTFDSKTRSDCDEDVVKAWYEDALKVLVGNTEEHKEGKEEKKPKEPFPYESTMVADANWPEPYKCPSCRKYAPADIFHHEKEIDMETMGFSYPVAVCGYDITNF